MSWGSYKAKYVNFYTSTAGASEPETPLLQEELGGKPLNIKPQSTFCLFICTALILFQCYWKVISGMYQMA